MLRILLGMGRCTSTFFALGALLACSPATPSPESPPPAAPTPAPVATPTAAPAPSATGAPAPSKAGPEGAMCGGLAGFGCASGLYCEFAIEAHCGAADMAGVCRKAPEVCTEEYAPVCGCDDKTYPNSCHAARAGVSVGKVGECATATLPEGKLCGTRGVAGECEAGLYCAFKANCGSADEGGVCTKKPQMCTKIYAPVCGCDSKTYGNACAAASAGVSVAAKGECKAH